MVRSPTHEIMQIGDSSHDWFCPADDCCSKAEIYLRLWLVWKLGIPINGFACKVRADLFKLLLDFSFFGKHLVHYGVYS